MYNIALLLIIHVDYLVYYLMAKYNLIAIYLISCFFMLLSHINSQLESDPSIKVKEPFYDDKTFFSEEIKSKYSHYINISESEELCTLVSKFENFPSLINQNILDSKCIPDVDSLYYLLDEGKLESAELLIKEYIKRNIDPSIEIKNWVSKKENRTKQIKNLLLNKPGNLYKPAYAFINYDNYVKFVVKLDKEYQIGKLTAICHKDLLLIEADFFYSTQSITLKERKKLFDEAEGDCEFNYNSFNQEIEVTLKKKYKLKKWTSLFKPE